MLHTLRHLSFIRMLLVAALFSVMLPVPQAHAAGTRVIKVVKYSGFDAAALTDTVDIYTTGACEIIESVEMVPDVDFAGTAITAYTISVGKSGEVTKYLPAVNVFTGVSNGTANSHVSSSRGYEVRGTTLIATATSVGGNLSAGTAGQVTFVINVSRCPAGI